MSNLHPKSGINPHMRVAVLDLYNNTPNQGMRCIRELLDQMPSRLGFESIHYDVFDTRGKAEVPGLNYDVYISTGGPGSPFDGEGKRWERAYFDCLDRIWTHNQNQTSGRKYALFICHSFQMVCRFFDLGQVVRRHSESFGIFPVHKTEAGRHDPLFSGLLDPFFAADFRKWQVIQPNRPALDTLGASVIGLEKKRPHVPYERAVMGIRISNEWAGVQFHPEADPEGMGLHFREPERRAFVIDHHGEEKYNRILHRLDDPNYIERTHRTLIPNFFRKAVHDAH